MFATTWTATPTPLTLDILSNLPPKQNCRKNASNNICGQQRFFDYTKPKATGHTLVHTSMCVCFLVYSPLLVAHSLGAIKLSNSLRRKWCCHHLADKLAAFERGPKVTPACNWYMYTHMQRIGAADCKGLCQQLAGDASAQSNEPSSGRPCHTSVFVHASWAQRVSP